MKLSVVLFIYLAVLFVSSVGSGVDKDTLLLKNDTGPNPSIGRDEVLNGGCAANGLGGECNECICCCSNDRVGIVRYRPTEDCECVSEIIGRAAVVGVLFAVVLIVGLANVTFFTCHTWFSPYPSPELLFPD